MASSRAIFIQNGLVSQVGNSDTLQVALLDTPSAGALTIGGANSTGVTVAEDVTFDASARTISGGPNAGGAGYQLTVKGGSSSNPTSAGGALELKGGTAGAGGTDGVVRTRGQANWGDDSGANYMRWRESVVVLDFQGTANVDLPNNASARFKIENTGVSANVTAANLGTLTAGAASNADALHTHSGVGSGTVEFTSQPNTIENVQIDKHHAVSSDYDLTALAPAIKWCTQTVAAGVLSEQNRCIGIAKDNIADNGTGTIICSGEVTIDDGAWGLSGAPGSATVGYQVYVGTQGHLTVTAPGSNLAAVPVGIVTYAGGGANTTKVLVQIHDPYIVP